MISDGDGSSDGDGDGNPMCSGLCSALSPAELRAAEAAERLLEQERKDLEIARRLQVVQCLSSH